MSERVDLAGTDTLSSRLAVYHNLTPEQAADEVRNAVGFFLALFAAQEDIANGKSAQEAEGRPSAA